MVELTRIILALQTVPVVAAPPAQATDAVTQAAGVLVVVGGMALVFLGLMQFLATFMKNSDKVRSELFDKLEDEKLENVRLTGQLFLYEAKYKEMQGYARKYYKLYRKHEDLALLKQENKEVAIKADAEKNPLT